MADLYLADTSAWVPYFRRPVRRSLRERIDRLAETEELATCDMVRLELLRGARDDAEFLLIEAGLYAAQALPTSAREWSEAINLGLRLKRAGVNVGAPDLLIAAVAITHQALLVHADADFEQIAQHSTLLTEPVFDLLPVA